MLASDPDNHVSFRFRPVERRNSSPKGGTENRYCIVRPAQVKPAKSEQIVLKKNKGDCAAAPLYVAYWREADIVRCPL